MPVSRLVIEPLGSRHDRATFSCGSEALDEYLRKRAGQDVRRRVARVFVCCKEDNSAILGFYTLSALSLDLSSLPEEAARRLPRHPVPTALLGRLAVSENVQGQGIGKMLIADAVKRVLTAGEQLAVYALVVDAKDDVAEQFYKHLGFVALADSSSRLFLPLASVTGG